MTKTCLIRPASGSDSVGAAGSLAGGAGSVEGAAEGSLAARGALTGDAAADSEATGPADSPPPGVLAPGRATGAAAGGDCPSRAAVVAVSPSLAGTLLAREKPSQPLTSRKASGLYLKKEAANALFLKKKTAGNLYLAKTGAPLPPVVGIAAGSAPFNASATTAGYIPTAFTSFATKGIAPAVITFSGQATCTAAKPTVELACPIQILVDGQATGKVNFAAATASSAKIAPLVHTVTQTTVLNKGGHTVAVQYAGAANVTFALKGWNLAVQAYPEAPEVDFTEQSGAGTQAGAGTPRG